jgi:serine/threonine-protein kinase
MSDIMSGQIPQLPREGEQVGAGVVLGLINTGGSAAVYKTWIDALELNRVVKVMHPDADDETRERMLTEARILSKLVHQNIIHVYNYGETASGLPFLEMDFVNGVTLESLIEKHGPLPLPVAFAIAAAALEALHYAHSLTYTLNKTPQFGVVHRDIKPENVMIMTETGGVKLMDFGIAQPIGISLHTEAGTAPGTLNYMSPEAYIDGNCDTRSDLYQIGLALYECISGRPAFPQTNRVALNDAKTANTYPPLNTASRAAAIVEKCMRLDPDERYQTAQECLADVRALYSALCRSASPEQTIKSFLTGAPVPNAKPKRNYMKLLKRPALAACLAVVAAGAIAAAVNYSPRIIPLAAKVYARLLASNPEPKEHAATPAPTPAQASTTEPKTALKTEPTPEKPAQAQTAAEKTADAKKTAPAPISTNKVDIARADKKNEDSALMLITQADILLADKKYNEALNSYQKAIKTPSTAPRQEVIRKSLYGSARCNSALFQAGQTSRSNYVAAWRSVANAYPHDSPQRVEAQEHLQREAAN